MIDPKVVELSVYNGIPHLFIPVVTDPKKAAGALNWAVSEMTSRYNTFAEYGVRNLDGIQSVRLRVFLLQKERQPPEKMPQIVIIVDELADLMMVAPGEVEDAICRLAQSGPCSRYPSDHCNTETFCKCHYGSDQGEYAVTELHSRFLPVWIPVPFWI